MVINNLIDNLSRRFIIVGGKGGVGKTSISASLAVTFASKGQKTLIISTDPAHSLSDSIDQDLSGGEIIKIEGIDNLYGMEIAVDNIGDDIRAISGLEEDEKLEVDLMSSLSSMGMGMDDMGNLFETMPPGVDEAMALAKVVQIIEQEEFMEFKRIIFDTAPTGHTLRLLSLPDFLDSFIGKLLKLKIKMSNIGNAFKSMFGATPQRDNSLEVMEKLKENMGKVKALFTNEETTEFMIATIPTIMAANESERLAEALKLEEISVKEVLINQIIPENNDCKFCSVRSRGQEDNLKYLRQLFMNYNITEIPFFDREIRGIHGLRFMGSKILDVALD